MTQSKPNLCSVTMSLKCSNQHVQLQRLAIVLLRWLYIGGGGAGGGSCLFVYLLFYLLLLLFFFFFGGGVYFCLFVVVVFYVGGALVRCRYKKKYMQNITGLIMTRNRNDFPLPLLVSVTVESL